MFIWILKKPNNKYIYNEKAIFQNKEDAILDIQLYINDHGIICNCTTSFTIIELQDNDNLFNDNLFLLYYKYFYFKAHILEPVLFPIKYIEDDKNAKCFKCEKKPHVEKQSKLMQRFLNDITCPLNYSIYNCIIKKIEFDIIQINCNDDKICELESLEDFICYYKNRQNQIILLNIYSKYTEALSFILKTIVKQHDFYILNSQLHFLKKYYIQNISIKYEFNNFNQNWYNIIKELNILLNITPYNIEKIKKLYNTYINYSNKLEIPSLLSNELELLCKKCKILI